MENSITNRNSRPNVEAELHRRKFEDGRDEIPSPEGSSFRDDALEMSAALDELDAGHTSKARQLTWLEPAFTQSLVDHMHAAKQFAIRDQRE